MFDKAVPVAILIACLLIPLDSLAEMLWIRDGKAIEQASAVLAAMREAQSFGLDPHDYRIDLPADEVKFVLRGTAPPVVQERFDSQLSHAATRFVRELHVGRIDPRRAGFHLPAASAEFDTDSALRQLAATPDVAAALESFEPKPAPYRRLKAALAKYRDIAAQPGLNALTRPEARSIKPGDEYSGAPQLRRLLIALGDLPAPTPVESHDTVIIDTALAEAVRAFQLRHGLGTDGIIGPRTFAALTTPLEHRVDQIELSMERWRWLAPSGKPDIVVNVPQFMLFGLPSDADASADVLEMRVIVGETSERTQTPVFTSSITQVVFQPYWDVPRGILLRELLPRIRKNRSFLDQHDMEIVRGEGDDARVIGMSDASLDALAAGTLRLRQRPGPKNALGPVKFVMRNPFNVYLHATPEQALFERAQRTFSHGCIRVSDPHALANYVLKNARDSWDEAAVDAALCRKDMLRVSLARPVDVVVFYATAVATRSQGVLFFDDVYGHDRKLQQLLAQR